jgi:hypothetical protein
MQGADGIPSKIATAAVEPQRTDISEAQQGIETRNAGGSSVLACEES